MVHQQQPFKEAECRQSLDNMGHGEREALWGSLPKCNNAISTNNDQALKVPQCNKIWALCSRLQKYWQRNVANTRGLMAMIEEMRMHRIGLCSWELQKREGKSNPGNPDANDFTGHIPRLGVPVLFVKKKTDPVFIRKIDSKIRIITILRDKNKTFKTAIRTRIFEDWLSQYLNYTKRDSSSTGRKWKKASSMIKREFCSAPILALPEGSEDFVVYCDASAFPHTKQGLKALCSSQRKSDSLCYSRQFTSSREELRPSDFIAWIESVARTGYLPQLYVIVMEDHFKFPGDHSKSLGIGYLA
ncbi:hypothetical protein Tco_0773402 [Tanacetum coccineum]|uniref:Reverse transcriptase/retrotransposon-derived protein RNase H-like domain-containing protein n=1 Tax=Tanacetum coccineum TaxID=301880 RepID=A0ABQ4ZNA2_9ASTR